MLEKLISNLKHSLSGSSKDSADKKEHSDEQNRKSHDTSNNENAESKKKNQVSMIIRVVVILGLAYLAVDHLLSPDLPPAVTSITPKSKKNKKKPAPADPIENAQKTASSTMPDVTPPESTTSPAIEKTQKVSEELPPIENINIASKVEEAVAAPGLPMPTPEVEKIVEAPVENPSEPPAPAVGEVKSKDHLEKSLDSLIDNVDNQEKALKSDSPKKKTMEETIVADDLYVAPPAYDQLGRGLVYNCKEKYWACVDKFAYVVCNKNMKWNNSHKKPTECAVNSVYNSEEDCSVVQKYNVSTSKITPFCQ